MSKETKRRKLLLVLILAATATLGASALTRGDADVAGWEAENMTGDPSKVVKVSNSNASGGQALRFTARGRADKLDQRFSTATTVLEVRARAVPDAGTWPTMKVYVDGTTTDGRIAAQVVDSSTYVTYRFDVSVPAGDHDVHIKAYENMEQGQELIVDRVAFDNAGLFGYEAVDSDDTAPASGDCDRLASTAGDDSGSGTVSDPFRTVDKLAESLSAGQTGCIRRGIYDQDVFVEGGGTPGNPITIRAYPGESVELRGTFQTNAAWVTVEGLKIDGSYGPLIKGAPYDRKEVHTRPAVEINASHTRWIGNDVSNRRSDDDPDHAGQGISISEGAADTHLIDNRVHHAGQVPPDNHQHCIYASQTTGLVMRGNTVYECADRGLQMHPDADDGLIEGNVFTYNGDVAISFSGKGNRVSENNLVRNNVISHTKRDRNVDAFEGQLAAGVEFPHDQADRNEVVNNCVFPGPNTTDPQTGGIEETDPKDKDYFHTGGNLIADPLYKDPAGGDYTLAPGSPCLSILSGG